MSSITQPIEEVLTQIKLSILSGVKGDISRTLRAAKVGLDIIRYKFEINCKNDNGVSFSFEVEIVKDAEKFLWIDTSKYKIESKVKVLGRSFNWSDYDTFEASSNKHRVLLKDIYNIVDREYLNREMSKRSEKMNSYIEMIKKTVDPSVSRDQSIDDVLK